MTLKNLIKRCDNLTPTEYQLAQYILQYKEKIQSLSIQGLSEETFVSKSAIHRFCKKIGVDGFNELKVRLAQDLMEERQGNHDVDANYPFEPNDSQQVIGEKLLNLYQSSLIDTFQSIDFEKLDNVVKLLHNADIIDVYTVAPNLYAAEHFKDKMLSIGKIVNCPKTFYEQSCTAIASTKKHVALIMSYSGKAEFIEPVVKMLNDKQIDIIFIGRVGVSIDDTNIKHQLFISDRENLRNKISQFSSHMGMQYMLDIIFGSIFEIDYEQNIRYTKEIIKLIDNRDIHED